MIKKFIRFIALMIYIIFALIPLYWIIITSLKNQNEIYSLPIKYLPGTISFKGYMDLFAFTNFAIYFRNSLIVSLATSFAVLCISALGGYAISRCAFRFKKYILLSLLFTQTIPLFLIIISLFNTFSQIGMMDNLITLVIIYINYIIPFGVIMAKAFFDRIPVALEEAALIDGCSRQQSLFKIVIPLTAPGLAALFIYSFINTWNELFLAVLFINSDVKITIPVALHSFVSKMGIDWAMMSAGIVLTLLPTTILFIFAQRYIVAGLTKGAIKG